MILKKTFLLLSGRTQAVNDEEHDANIKDKDQKMSVIKQALYYNL